MMRSAAGAVPGWENLAGEFAGTCRWTLEVDGDEPGRNISWRLVSERAVVLCRPGSSP